MIRELNDTATNRQDMRRRIEKIFHPTDRDGSKVFSFHCEFTMSLEAWMTMTPTGLKEAINLQVQELQGEVRDGINASLRELNEE